MAFPSRTLRAVCEISSGTLKISQRPPAYTHEAGALSVVVDLKNNDAAYVPDASVVAGMYLFWQDTQYMSELVEMGISGCTLSGTFSDALTAMPGCPMLVIQLQDTDTSDIIVAAAAPIQITKVEGNLIVTTRPPSPSDVVYVGRSPYINTLNNHWMQWNSTDHAYEDTGVVAKGVPATFTATAQGLPAGSTPTATITGTAENPVINLGIPKGDTGDTGATGPAAGFGTIAATVDNTSGTPGVTVSTSGPDTAKNMTFAFTGLKGPQGEPGPVSQVCGVSPNAQGNVPLKGTDIPLQTMSLVTVKQAIESVDGKTGSDIDTSDSDNTPIATSLSNLNDQIVPVSFLDNCIWSITPEIGLSFVYSIGKLCVFSIMMRTPNTVSSDELICTLPFQVQGVFATAIYRAWDGVVSGLVRAYQNRIYLVSDQWTPATRVSVNIVFIKQ